MIIPVTIFLTAGTQSTNSEISDGFSKLSEFSEQQCSSKNTDSNHNIKQHIPKIYIVNYGNSTISICNLNPDQSIGACTATNLGGSLNFPATMAVNPAETYAFITNFDNYLGTTITVCALNFDGSFRTPCSINNGNGTFDQPNDSQVNNAGTWLYIANGGFSEPSSVTRCPLFRCGVSTQCIRQFNLGPLGSNSLGFNPSNTLAYIANYFSSDVTFTGLGMITICQVNPDGSFGTCVEDSASGTLNGPIDVEINAANTFAYISNLGNSTLSICPINLDGTLGACTTTDGNGTINGPAEAMLSADQTILYIANNNSNTISVCPVLVSGLLGTCIADSDPSYNVPNDVIIF